MKNKTESDVKRGLIVKGGGVAPDTIVNAMQAVETAGINPAWDELAQKVVFRASNLPWDATFGRVLDDHSLRMVRALLIQRHAQNAFLPSRENVFEALMTVAYSRKFNPVTDWLAGLHWDGVPRVAGLFPTYFNVKDDAYARAVSKCFAVGAVRRARHPGSKFDTMPIVKSPQGLLKSTGVKALFGAEWFSDADLGNLQHKDAAMLLRGKWIQEFAEIDALSRAETATLKAFCSRAVDRLRDPYDKIVRDVPRRSVFIATVNESGYLRDSTGGRRFWPMTSTGEVHVAALKRDRDQLWAEAAALEAAGESDVMARELWPVAADRQAAETTADPWCDALRVFLEVRAEDAFEAVFAADMGEPADSEWPVPPADRVHTSELAEALGIKIDRATKGTAQRVRTVMEHGLGWRHNRNVRIGERIGAGYMREPEVPTEA